MQLKNPYKHGKSFTTILLPCDTFPKQNIYMILLGSYDFHNAKKHRITEYKHEIKFR